MVLAKKEEVSELISVRESARRLGVSDTSVHKAIKSGRIQVANRTEKSNRPLLSWPSLQTEWLANSDESKRSHGGVATALTPPNPTLLPESSEDDAQNFARSRAMKESYLALLAQLEYEEKAGLLVRAADVKLVLIKQVKAATTIISGIASACKIRIADLSPKAVKIIQDECREALKAIADERPKPD